MYTDWKTISTPIKPKVTGFSHIKIVVPDTTALRVHWQIWIHLIGCEAKAGTLPRAMNMESEGFVLVTQLKRYWLSSKSTSEGVEKDLKRRGRD